VVIGLRAAGGKGNFGLDSALENRKPDPIACDPSLGLGLVM
jgi:hypothetical protein